MPTWSKSETSAIHRVLIDSAADPKLIHPAIEEIRSLSGQNVITAIGAQITELRSDVQAQINELQLQIIALRAEMKTLYKFIWMLTGLLAIHMLAVVYKFLAS